MADPATPLAIRAGAPIALDNSQLSLASDPDLFVEFILAPIATPKPGDMQGEVTAGITKPGESPTEEEAAAIALALWLLTPARTQTGSQRWRRERQSI